MKKLKKLWNEHKVWFIIGVIILLILFCTFCFFYSKIALNFTKDNPKGELFKVILSVLGGAGIIYGLWLNSQRIKAQNKQNKLVEDRNLDQKSYDSDKRFGEAIGYLGSGNTSIVLGGIYALNQLAKEDTRYKPIVAGLFTSYLQSQSHKQYKEIEIINPESTSEKPQIPILIKTIIELLFSSTKNFEGIILTFSNTQFKHIEFSEDVTDCYFNSCVFYDCTFSANITNCIFRLSRIEKYCSIGRRGSLIENCNISQTSINQSRFKALKMNGVEFEFSVLKNVVIDTKELINCDFTTVNSDSVVKFINIDSFKGTMMYKEEEMFKFYKCNNLEEIAD